MTRGRVRDFAQALTWRGAPVAVRWFGVGLTLATALYVLWLALPSEPGARVMEPAYDVLFLAAAVLCVARAVRSQRERPAFMLLALALTLYTAGNLYYTHVLGNTDNPPVPSLSDALWLPFYPLAYAALWLLARKRMRRLHRRLWVDGVIAMLTVSAVAATLVFEAVRTSTEGDAAAIATNLAYPLADMVLIGLAVGVMAAGRARLDRTFVVFALGASAFAISDSIYLLQIAQETYKVNSIIDAGWLIGVVTIACSAWQPRRLAREQSDEPAGLAVPVSLALVSLALLVYDHFERVDLLALALATAALLAITARLTLTHWESVGHLRRSQRQARTDVLTGIGNRLRLIDDLRELQWRDGGMEPHLLVMCDLDGFKLYNDTFGHPAGDALLIRLGGRLAEAVQSSGTAYRMGGDEFCVLAPWQPGMAIAPYVARLRRALSDEGEGFSVGASCGHALMPEEGAGASDALRVADRRLYTEKRRGRASAGRQSKDVLLQALDECDAELGAHVQDVAVLAEAVARRLRLPDEEVERVAHAAALHDVGKIAIPAGILHKRGPLDADEWAFMRRHTVIGERILMAAPALAGVGALVRSSHERWDGNGYPDGLAGEQIPIGSQIVFVCDAYCAMTADRPYRRGMSEAAALAELRRHVGTQFRPDVVEAFIAVQAERAAVALAAVESERFAA